MRQKATIPSRAFLKAAIIESSKPEKGVLMKPSRIVLTGGPCAGKTTIAQVLEKAFADRVTVLPESASLLFSGGFPRWPEVKSLEALQRAIYRVQVELETCYGTRFPQRILVMDRGTVDGAGYWPKGPEDFYRSMNTAVATELGRYDLAIYLESAGREAYDLNRQRNPDRNESWEEAAALDLVTRHQWEVHPRFLVIKNNTSFSSKIAAVLTAVEGELKKV